MTKPATIITGLISSLLELLIYSKHCAKSFNAYYHVNLIQQKLLWVLLQFLQIRKLKLGKLSNFLKITHLTSNKGRIYTEWFYSRTQHYMLTRKFRASLISNLATVCINFSNLKWQGEWTQYMTTQHLCFKGPLLPVLSQFGEIKRGFLKELQEDLESGETLSLLGSFHFIQTPILQFFDYL